MWRLTKTGTLVGAALLMVPADFWKTRIPEPLQVLSAIAIAELSICTEVDVLGPPLAKDCPELNAVTSFCGITCGIFAESTHARLFCAEVVASVTAFIEATWLAKLVSCPWARDRIWNDARICWKCLHGC